MDIHIDNDDYEFFRSRITDILTAENHALTPLLHTEKMKPELIRELNQLRDYTENTLLVSDVTTDISRQPIPNMDIHIDNDDYEFFRSRITDILTAENHALTPLLHTEKMKPELIRELNQLRDYTENTLLVSDVTTDISRQPIYLHDSSQSQQSMIDDKMMVNDTELLSRPTMNLERKMGYSCHRVVKKCRTSELVGRIETNATELSNQPTEPTKRPKRKMDNSSVSVAKKRRVLRNLPFGRHSNNGARDPSNSMIDYSYDY